MENDRLVPVSCQLAHCNRIRNKDDEAVSKLAFTDFSRREGYIMFQLFELILASPIGAFIFAGVQNMLYAVILVADCDDCGFNDLGKLLFGGMIAAILVGVVISVWLRRMKEKAPATSAFVSIMSNDRKP